MKKSVRINLLVITIVVTLFIFAGLWYLRPGVSDEILQQARIRQSQPLMEINEPLRKPKAEDFIDTAQLAKDLKRDLEPSIKASIKADLLADPAFAKADATPKIDVAALRGELQTAIKDELFTDPAFAAAVNQQVDVLAIRSQIQPAIKRGVLLDLRTDSAFIRSISSQIDLASVQVANSRALTAVSQANDQAIASLRREINAQIAALPKTPAAAQVDEALVHRMIAEAVDAQIPVVVEAVVARIEANRDRYIEALRAQLGDVVVEDEVVDLYLGYRNALVQDLVPEILDDVEALLKGEPATAQEVKRAVEVAPVLPATPVQPTAPVSTAAPVAPQAAPAVPVVPAPPTPAVTTVTAKPAAATPAVPAPQPPAPPAIEPAVSTPAIEPAVSTPAVSTPVVEPAVSTPAVSTPVPEVPAKETMVTHSVEEAEYEVERQRLRTEAINEVLKKIGL